MKQHGFLAWEGRSPLTGDQVALVVTSRSRNEKTGPMVQTWLLLRDVPPFEAVRTNQDAAVCGGCARRGTGGGQGRTCYVNLFTGPTAIWKAMQAGRYPLLKPAAAAAQLAGESVRVTAYGDPVVLPFGFWQQLLAQAAGWVGYTHLWEWADPRFRQILMASVDTPQEAALAEVKGWRTFRARSASEPVQPWEVVCPASPEGGHRSTCIRCQLCRGTSRPAKQIVILEHGRIFGQRGKHDDTRRQLDAGPVVLAVTERERMRLVLALRQFYIRRGDPRRVATKKMGHGQVQFSLVQP